MKNKSKFNPNYKYYDEIRTKEEETFISQSEKKSIKNLKKIKTNDQERPHNEKSTSFSKINDDVKKEDSYNKNEISVSNDSDSEREETNDDLKNIKTNADRLSKIAYNLFMKNVNK